MSGGRTGTARTVPLRAVPDDRRITLITELLRLSADPHMASAAWEGMKGTGQALPLRPHEPRCPVTNRNATGRTCKCWIRSLDELDRAMGQLKRENRACWYAVLYRYKLATRKPTVVTVKGGRPMLELNQAAVGLVSRADLNKRGDGQTRLLVETWRHGLDPSYVTRGLVLLADLFQGSPQLPVEMLNAA